MKKLFLLLVGLSSLMMAADTEVLGNAQQGVAESGVLAASILVLVIVLFWAVPIIVGAIVYVSMKKKKEQQHEEIGLGDAFKVLLAVIVSGAASFYIVGSIGKMASGGTATDLAQGNGYFLKPILDLGLKGLGAS